MRIQLMIRFLFLVLGMTLSVAAFAHPGAHAHGILSAGFGDPFAGADVFAAVCAAIWAAMLGRRFLGAAFRSAGKKNGR
jgi:hydrogenase/urease accessory protein HupE